MTDEAVAPAVPGLAVARGFMEAMNGELAVEEAPGGGTAFVISLARAVA